MPPRLNNEEFLTPMQKAGGEQHPVNIPPMAPQRIPIAPPTPETVFNSRGTNWASDRYGTSDPQHMSDLYNAEKMYRRLGPEQMQGIAAGMQLRAPRQSPASNPWGLPPGSIQDAYEKAHAEIGKKFVLENNRAQTLELLQAKLQQARETLGDGNTPEGLQSIRDYQDAAEYANRLSAEVSREKEEYIRRNPHFQELEAYAPMPTPYTPGLYGEGGMPPVPNLFRGFVPEPRQQPAGPQPPPVAPPEAGPSTVLDDFPF